jgi:hypothetical protein
MAVAFLEFTAPKSPLARAKTACIFSRMKVFAVRCLIVLVILAAASFAFANPFKSKITGTSSPLVITVPDDHFLKITNFTQEGGVDRGVVIVTLEGGINETATVLTATRIDLSTGTNAQHSPEISNPVIIAGPAQVTVAPVMGATLFITYRKESNEGGGGGGGTATPIPFVSPTPGATATPSIFPPPSATATATPTATPTPTASPTPTPTPTASPTPTPTPTGSPTPTPTPTASPTPT